MSSHPVLTWRASSPEVKGLPSTHVYVGDKHLLGQAISG
jgi:hypothetical protein